MAIWLQIPLIIGLIIQVIDNLNHKAIQPYYNFLSFKTFETFIPAPTPHAYLNFSHSKF
jgi:hypothetical protein